MSERELTKVGVTDEPERLTRREIINALVERDGDECFYCHRAFNDDRPETIDHWIPRSRARELGWTESEIWALTNLRLSCKPCNAKKGNLVPNEDGSIPKHERGARRRAIKRAGRPEVCPVCESGRKLGPDEECASCGSGPMPEKFPRWAKVKVAECDHSDFWCWMCSIGIIERVPAIVDVLDGDYSPYPDETAWMEDV